MLRAAPRHQQPQHAEARLRRLLMIGGREAQLRTCGGGSSATGRATVVPEEQHSEHHACSKSAASCFSRRALAACGVLAVLLPMGSDLAVGVV